MATYYGTRDADILVGTASSEELLSGEGNDTVYGGRSAIDPDDEHDVIYAGYDDDLVYGNGGDDLLHGGSRDRPNGPDGNDTIYGGSGADTIHGMDGVDRIYGGGDVFSPNDDADLIFGGGDEDWITGNGGDDTIYGAADTTGLRDDNDTINGGQGNDYIDGGDGTDFISGQLGNDTLIGGRDADIFMFSDQTGNDTVFDFQGAGDIDGDLLHISENINGSGILTPEDVLARATISADFAIIDLGAGNQLTVQTDGFLSQFDILIS
ncbi:MAG: hypothetical protein CMM94_07760 [Rickettsiales bacterium]|nr:hypothetical protein [Rickettsiales bacterium]